MILGTCDLDSIFSLSILEDRGPLGSHDVFCSSSEFLDMAFHEGCTGLDKWWMEVTNLDSPSIRILFQPLEQ